MNDGNEECTCTPCWQDAGGGHTELLMEPDPDCPEHFETNRYGERVFKPEPGYPHQYIPDESKPMAVIVDLDGTLCRKTWDRPMYGPGFEEHVYSDDVDLPVLFAVNTWRERGGTVLFMSGRSDISRSQTVCWLRDKAGLHEVEYVLLMRTHRDFRPDYEIKGELFDAHVRDHYYVQLALDDRNQVVDMWRRIGIPCWQVAEGNF